MPDSAPYCDYQMTVRVEIPNQPGQFARIATALAEEGANLGAIDIVEVPSSTFARPWIAYFCFIWEARFTRDRKFP